MINPDVRKTFELRSHVIQVQSLRPALELPPLTSRAAPLPVLVRARQACVAKRAAGVSARGVCLNVSNRSGFNRNGSNRNREGLH